jgi:zinc protease
MKYLLGSLLLVSACSAPATQTPPAPAPTAEQEPVQEPEQEPEEEQAPTALRAAHSVRPWEHTSSDIPVDPRIHFGSLANGMRFAWADNSEPQERVYLRMHVDAGSFAETDAEHGMAHFLEHMAFNGSEHFEAGTLIEWFQEHGMSFGADTNAHTTFSETVYKLDLPDRDEGTIREGLVVLRDFAGGLLLADEEVQNEKGVIDSEERERDSAQYRVFLQRLDEQYAGTLYSTRMPIGTKEVRDEFNARNVRAFYEKWYRPENITLVIVGDLRERNPEALVAEVFGDFAGPGTPVAAEPDRGTPPTGERFFFIPEPEIPVAVISIAELKPFVDRPDTIAQRQKNMARQIAHAILNIRFEEAVKEEGTPLVNARLGGAGGLEIFEGGELTVVSTPDKWQDAMTAGIVELRTALQFGYQQAELDEVRAEILRGLDEAVKREATVPSAALFGRLVTTAELGGTPTDAATNREILRPALEALTVEACLEALREDWEGGELCCYALGALELSDPEAQLRATHAAAFEAELVAPEVIETSAFAYASDPARIGEIANRETIEDLGLTTVEFENGVRLNLLVTDFAERQILVHARLGGGELALADDALPVAEIGGEVFGGGGLEAHSIDELRRILAGKQVSVGMAVEPDHFRFGGATTGEDLLLEFELICAQIEHPGYRSEALVVLRQELPLVFEQYRHTPAGPTIFEFLPEVLLGDPRATILGLDHGSSLEELMAVEMDEVRGVFAPAFEGAPLEITAVGDLDLEETIALAARTFGVLPKRRPAVGTTPAVDGAHIATGIHVESSIETRDTKAVLLMLFPTGDGLNIARRRHIQFLGQIVDDRLRLVVREELGAAYSPFAFAQASRIFPGLGAVMVQAACEPSETEQLIAACRRVATDLQENGVTEEEVKRLSEPLLNQLRDARRNNAYWVGVLAEAQGRPESLDELRSVVEFYETLDAEALSEVAGEVMDPERASTLVVVPAGAAEEKE